MLFALIALCALAVSLPMEWFTLHNASFTPDRPFGNFADMMPESVDITVSGLKGSINFLVKIPIWFLAVIGMAGAVIALLNRAGIILVPVWGICIPIFFSGAYMAIGLWVALKDDASPGIGIITGLAGIILALLAALTSRVREDTDE